MSCFYYHVYHFSYRLYELKKTVSDRTTICCSQLESYKLYTFPAMQIFWWLIRHSSGFWEVWKQLNYSVWLLLFTFLLLLRGHVSWKLGESPWSVLAPFFCLYNMQDGAWHLVVTCSGLWAVYSSACLLLSSFWVSENETSKDNDIMYCSLTKEMQFLILWEILKSVSCLKSYRYIIDVHSFWWIVFCWSAQCISKNIFETIPRKNFRKYFSGVKKICMPLFSVWRRPEVIPNSFFLVAWLRGLFCR